MTNILIGTSDFTAEGWVGSFYPAGMQPRHFLSLLRDKIQHGRTRQYFLPDSREVGRKTAEPGQKICNQTFEL
jgi:hypothetical protein